MEEDPEEHLVSSFSLNLICKIIYRSCVFIYMTWEERGGFMSRGAYIRNSEISYLVYSIFGKNGFGHSVIFYTFFPLIFGFGPKN